jgi:Tn3 transposase DDE domain
VPDGLGTNSGFKRLAGADLGTTYQDLHYVRSRYIRKEQLRNAIAHVANAIFQVRRAEVWGEGTTACASDSKKFGAWNQNLLTEWHIRYRGPGIMVYWHVEKKATCIYSQVKSCSSSEVAAMIEGILRHCTDAEIQKNFVDTYGQSEIGFAFCHLLAFRELLGMHMQQMKDRSATYVFESSHRSKYSDRGVRKMLARDAVAAGITRSMSPHKWLHFLFTWLKKHRITRPHPTIQRQSLRPA